MNPLSRLRIVLVRPHSPGNIGACARAMGAMGLDQLWLVAPLRFPHPDATRRATEAVAILERARIVDRLADALSDCSLVIAASARQRSGRWPLLTPSQTADKILDCSGSTALVFGPERSGLSNADLYQAQFQTIIPMAPGANSLNLSHALQIYAWELVRRQPPPADETQYATHEEMSHLYDSLMQALQSLNFNAPDKLLLRYRTLLNRARPSHSEWSLLEGLVQRISGSFPDGPEDDS